MHVYSIKRLIWTQQKPDWTKTNAKCFGLYQWQYYYHYYSMLCVWLFCDISTHSSSWQHAHLQYPSDKRWKSTQLFDFVHLQINLIFLQCFIKFIGESTGYVILCYQNFIALKIVKKCSFLKMLWCRSHFWVGWKICTPTMMQLFK